MKYIDLTQGQKAIVDDEDFEKLNRYKWHVLWNKDTKSFYAMRSIYNGKEWKTTLMARIIMNASPDRQVDHINHDTLDNRKSNLRLVNYQQNQFNQMSHNKNKTSQYKGVSYDRTMHKWRTRICKDGVRYFLGRFKNEKKAAMAYNEAARRMFGEYAHINTI